MARTLNAAAYAVRREEFLDAAQALIQTRGYEEMSIQDILDAAEASRGAFYHYFDSKAALLEAIVDRLSVSGLAAVAPVVDDPALSAIEKFTRVFSGIAQWKIERKDLMLALLRVWYSDENALVREKLRRNTLAHMTPLVARIIKQGVAEGVFTAGASDDSARVLLTLMLGAADVAGEMFFARQAGTMSFEAVRQRLTAFSVAVERLLGAPDGTVTIVDDATLGEWFG